MNVYTLEVEIAGGTYIALILDSASTTGRQQTIKTGGIAMEPLIGIFRSSASAETALNEILAAGVTKDQIMLLAPQTSLAQVPTISTPEPDAPGACGAKAGHIAGAIAGFASGLLGATTATLFIPGVGPILAVGTITLGTVLGVVAGSMIGGAVQDATTLAVPPDHFFVYADTLRQGRWLLIVQPADTGQVNIIQRTFTQADVQSFDAAREEWWRRLGEAGATATDRFAEEFPQDKTLYRRGFEAALDMHLHGQSYEDASGVLQQREPHFYQEETFQQGYERGRTYYHTMRERYRQEAAEPSE